MTPTTSGSLPLTASMEFRTSESISSALGAASNASIDSHPTTVLSRTPSALFSASSSLSSMSTPQHYKNVKPLQDAFNTTGLTSKAQRGTGKRPRASAPGSLPLSGLTPHKAMPDTPVKSKASRSQSFISLRQPPVNNLSYGGLNLLGSDPHQDGPNPFGGGGSAYSRRHARISTESSSHMRRAVSAGVVSTPPRSYEAMFNEATEAAAAEQKVERFANEFTILSVLGSGEFSEAVEVEQRSTRTRYAIKRTKRPATGTKARLRRLEEVDILRELSSIRHDANAKDGAPSEGHPNVVRLIDAWEEEGHLFMQLELCPLGNFSDFLEEHGVTEGPMDEPRLWKILAELTSGLGHIHSNGILHLDIKPANVFLSLTGSLKIGDFGLATRWPRSRPAEIVDGAGLVIGPDDELDRVALELAEQIGSPNLDDMDLPRFGLPGSDHDRGSRMAAGAASPTKKKKLTRVFRRPVLEREGDREYLAPEIMSRGQYGKPADMYSLGILMLEAAANVVIPDNGEAYQKLRNDDFSDVDLSHLSEQMTEVLTGPRGLLRSEPSARISADELQCDETIKRVRDWMARGLTKIEESRLAMMATSRLDAARAAAAPQTPFAVREIGRIPSGTLEDDDPFQTRPTPTSLTSGSQNSATTEVTSPGARSLFGDAQALTTPVNGFRVLYPPPPSPFPSTELSPIRDLPASQEAESSPLGGPSTQSSASTPIANLASSITVPWRGAIVEEDHYTFMNAVLEAPAGRNRGPTSVDIDDVEMSF
ncbi:mitosis inhibitor protein kinase swe1 [Tilletia horrida]|nr:mitosis inhibitor protein kinase swe1 [Tilletia horrida]